MKVDPRRWQMVRDNPEIRDGYETGICVRAELPNGNRGLAQVLARELADAQQRAMRLRGGGSGAAGQR